MAARQYTPNRCGICGPLSFWYGRSVVVDKANRHSESSAVRKHLFAAAFLALVVPGHSRSQVTSARIHILAPRRYGPAHSIDYLILDVKRSTTFLTELETFLNSVSEHEAKVAEPYAPLVEAFNEAASKEGVAATSSANLVDLSYDWTDRAEWKYFVRPEVDFAVFHALFESAKADPVYRAVTLACLIYGGQGIQDFKRYVPDYIDLRHDQEEFRTIKFDPGNKRLALWAERLAAQKVALYVSRYRPALAYLRRRGIDSATLRRAAQAEQGSEVKSIMLDYAELLQVDAQPDAGDDLALRISILLRDVERESPELVTAILRTLEKHKQAVFDKTTNIYDVDRAAFGFLMEAKRPNTPEGVGPNGLSSSKQ